MRNVELQKLLPARGLALGPVGPGEAFVTAPPLLAVLVRRWRTMALTVLACVAGAAAFLALATRTYRASATIYIQPNPQRVFGDSAGAVPVPETYLQTQADVIRSTPVLVRALDGIQYTTLRTFGDVKGSPAVWLQRGRLGVEVVKRSDVIVVSMDSPYPEEAATVVDGVVNAYIVEQSHAARKSATDMVRVLEKEREQVLLRRAAAQEKMLAAQRERGEPTFRDGKGNLALGRLDALANSLNAAEVAVMELRAQREATLAAMGAPEGLRAFVEGLQFRGRDTGDREYDELRSQLVTFESQVTGVSGIQGSNHPRVRAIQATVEDLKRKIAAKERSIAESQLADVSSRLGAAEEKASQVRRSLEDARARALDLSPGEAAYAKLESEVLELEKRGDLLDRRVAELNVNSADAGAMNVRVLQPAIVPERPVKPNKPLTLAAALLVGCVLGVGLATLREWQDARIRTPDEISALLGLPLVGVVPQINRSLSPADRGQVLRLDPRSAVAEAYRSIRTSLYLGDARSAKTILVASPSSGDGKSTTAANLAIAFAQAGERTLLLDCDLREPVQHLIFGAAGTTGVSTVMPGETKLQDGILPTRVANLYLLPCGPVPRNPSETLASDRFRFLLKTLCEAFDRIVIDSPALEKVADGRILAAAADATVLVLRMNQSMQRSGVIALAGLNDLGANVLGAVANDVRTGVSFRLDGDPWHYTVGRGRDAIGGTDKPGGQLPSPAHVNVKGSPRGAAGVGAAAGVTESANAPSTGHGVPNGHAAALSKNVDVNPFSDVKNVEVNPFSDAFSGPLPHFSSEVISIAGPNWPAEKP